MTQPSLYPTIGMEDMRTLHTRIGSAPTYRAPQPVNAMTSTVTTHIPQGYDISGTRRSNAHSEIQNNELDLDTLHLTSKCQTCKERGKGCPLKYDQHGRCQECARLGLDCIQSHNWQRMSATERTDFTVKRKSAAKSARKTHLSNSSTLRSTTSQPGEGPQSARLGLHTSVGEMTIMGGRAGSNLTPMGSSNLNGLHNGNTFQHHLAPPTLSVRTVRMVNTAPPQNVALPSSMSVGAYNQPQVFEVQNSMRHRDSTYVSDTVGNGALSMPKESVGYTGLTHGMTMMPRLDATDMDTDFVTGAFRPRPQSRTDLPQSPFPSNFTTHSVHRSYDARQPVPNHLLNPQVHAPHLRPALSPATRYNPIIRHPPPSASNLYDEIVRFQAYISPLIPRASRIVIETEGTDGPEFMDLSALLRLVNSSGPP